jgi:hypothetical protein
VDVPDIDVERRRTDRVDDDDVEIAVVPSDDAGAIFVAKVDLPLADHRLLSPQPSLPRLFAAFAAA